MNNFSSIDEIIEILEISAVNPDFIEQVLDKLFKALEQVDGKLNGNKLLRAKALIIPFEDVSETYGQFYCFGFTYKNTNYAYFSSFGIALVMSSKRKKAYLIMTPFNQQKYAFEEALREFGMSEKEIKILSARRKYASLRMKIPYEEFPIIIEDKGKKTKIVQKERKENLEQPEEEKVKVVKKEEEVGNVSNEEKEAVSIPEDFFREE